MTDYIGLAAAELAKIVQANDELAARARKAREGLAVERAAEMEAEVTATSFRLAEDYTTLAALERHVPLAGAPPRSQAGADEFAAAERAAGCLPAHRKE
jgi:hypothetical protein